MRGLLLISLLILTSAPVGADTGSLRAIVSSSNAPPYALFVESGDLAGGISKDILEALASRSTLTLNFLPLPRGRVEHRVQQTLQLMIDDGTIQRILLRYQPAVRNE